jgi:replicative DNA helicase
VTLKTFLPAEIDIAGLTLAQYLARLAAEATTIINAVDYGRTIYDLATRRELITIGEDMVNVAFDAPVDFAPRDQIEDAERRLYELAEIGRYGGGFQRFERRSPPRSTWRHAPTSAREGSPAWQAASRTSTTRWAVCRPQT